ncbi:hypothetical protein [Deinococcus alpinitundrae]|uniref:hypothetical protein n=1 Tax=Deinococcus alpinitundrae TaxID=468913 RepID=UPI00137A524B|nr:hypothetical protein [Deinococcus alpinitundrae]
MTFLRLVPAALLTAALLGACGRPAAPKPLPAAEVAPFITGQLSGASSTSLALIVGTRTLASTTVDAQGKFSLTLPTSDEVTSVKTSLSAVLLADLGCKGSLSLSDPSAQGYGFATLKAGNQKDYADAVVIKDEYTFNRSLKGRAYLYADKPTTLNGPLDCKAATGFPTTLQVNVNLSTGWNVLALSINGTYSFPSTISVSGSVNNGALAPGSVWSSLDALKSQIAF